jgi:phenylpropionate dioxygenase-like ring-hydroxylating dioxygenase large terminal subunit
MGDLYVTAGWDVLAENLLDPSHVNFSHHGVIGTR